MEVEVRSDIEVAIHRLKKLLLRDGIHGEIKRREKYPNPTDRRKAKDREAVRRRLKALKKKEYQLACSLQSGVMRYASEGR